LRKRSNSTRYCPPTAQATEFDPVLPADREPGSDQHAAEKSVVKDQQLLLPAGQPSPFFPCYEKRLGIVCRIGQVGAVMSQVILDIEFHRQPQRKRQPDECDVEPLAGCRVAVQGFML
jgi:hypothetical protein